MRVFTYKLIQQDFFDWLGKTRIKVFKLDLKAKARMIDHAFLGRFRDEYDDGQNKTLLKRYDDATP